MSMSCKSLNLSHRNETGTGGNLLCNAGQRTEFSPIYRLVDIRFIRECEEDGKGGHENPLIDGTEMCIRYCFDLVAIIVDC